MISALMATTLATYKFTISQAQCQRKRRLTKVSLEVRPISFRVKLHFPQSFLAALYASGEATSTIQALAHFWPLILPVSNRFRIWAPEYPKRCLASFTVVQQLWARCLTVKHWWLIANG